MGLHFPELDLCQDGATSWGRTDPETAHRFVDLLALLDATREAEAALMARTFRRYCSDRIGSPGWRWRGRCKRRPDQSLTLSVAHSTTPSSTKTPRSRSNAAFLSARRDLQVEVAATHAAACARDLTVKTEPGFQRLLDLITVDRQPNEDDLYEQHGPPSQPGEPYRSEHYSKTPLRPAPHQSEPSTSDITAGHSGSTAPRVTGGEAHGS
jgi:hypothetical protein